MKAKQRENLVKKCEEIYTKTMQLGQTGLALEAVRMQFSIEREEPDPRLGERQE